MDDNSSGDRRKLGGFLLNFFQNEGFFWRQIFEKGIDHYAVEGSENDHLTCPAKRRWILSRRSDQKPNSAKK